MALFEMESVLVVIVLRQNGSPLPGVETNEAHIYFIARLFVRDGFYDYEGGNNSSTTEETSSTDSGTTKETTKDPLMSAIRKNVLR